MLTPHWIGLCSGLRPLIQQHGLPERLLAKGGSYFVALAKSICFQQLAISAASAIFKRFLATCGVRHGSSCDHGNAALLCRGMEPIISHSMQLL